MPDSLDWWWVVDPWQLDPLPQTTNWPTHLGIPAQYDCFCCSNLKPFSFFRVKASLPPTFVVIGYWLSLFCFLWLLMIFFSSPFSHRDCWVKPPALLPMPILGRQIHECGNWRGTIHCLNVVNLSILLQTRHGVWLCWRLGLLDLFFTWLVIDEPQGHRLHLLFPSCPKRWVIIQAGGAPSMDNCIHIVVDHHEGGCYLMVWSHKAQALKLSIVWAPGSGEAQSVSFTVVE